MLPRHADDLDIELPSTPAPHALADGVAAEIELLDERVVDERDFRRVQRVGARDFPPGEQRNAQRAEVVGPDVGVHRLRIGVGSGGESLDGEAAAPRVARRETDHGRGDTRHSRKLAQPFFDARENLMAALRRVAVQHWRDTKHDELIGVQSRDRRA